MAWLTCCSGMAQKTRETISCRENTKRFAITAAQPVRKRKNSCIAKTKRRNIYLSTIVCCCRRCFIPGRASEVPKALWAMRIWMSLGLIRPVGMYAGCTFPLADTSSGRQRGSRGGGSKDATINTFGTGFIMLIILYEKSV